MGSFVDLTGRKFDRLTVISRAPSVNRKTFWNCKCSCSNLCISRADSLLDGMIRSCGCLRLEIACSPKGYERGKSRLERFEERYIPEPNSGCWLWLGSVNETTGYGRFYLNEEEVVYAHNFSFKHHKGKIPRGLMLRHTCDVKICVNPEHIITGTAKQNAQDAVERGQKLIGAQHPMCRLSEIEVIDIFVSEESIAATAERFAISRMHVQRIKEKKIWKELLCAL
jgi:HNH endonuclease